jgi:hypothetical protein
MTLPGAIGAGASTCILNGLSIASAVWLDFRACIPTCCKSFPVPYSRLGRALARGTFLVPRQLHVEAALPDDGLLIVARGVQGRSDSGVNANPGWSRKFDEPVPLPGGGELRTLHDAADYIMNCRRPTSGSPNGKLPTAEHEAPEWQAVCFGATVFGRNKTEGRHALPQARGSNNQHDVGSPRSALALETDIF